MNPATLWKIHDTRKYIYAAGAKKPSDLLTRKNITAFYYENFECEV